MRRLGQFLVELNLFKTNNRDEHHLRLQRWSTRLYIPLLFLSMVILLVYTIFEIISEQIQVPNPSLSVYAELSNKYENIKCPCRDISVSHRTFLQMSPSYHQICSSDFVSEDWIRFLFDSSKTTIRYAVDFRATAMNQFSLLKELCEVSGLAINDGIESLYQSELISGQLLNENLFLAQVEANILASRTIIISDFTRSLVLMRSFMAGNEMITNVETAYSFIGQLNDAKTRILSTLINTNTFVDANGTVCTCDNDFSCHIAAGFYGFDSYNSGGTFNLSEISPEEFVRNWQVGCWPIESLLMSSLQTFYNQTEVNRILNYVNSSALPNQFHALNESKTSHFNRNSSIQTLVDQLFVEEWSKILNHSSYFGQCQPQFCQYSIEHRPEPLYIITSLLGLYGGLSIVLHLIIPYFIKYLLQKFDQRSMRRREEAMNRSDDGSCLSLDSIKNLLNILLHLNFYRSTMKREAQDIKNQICSTRIYLGLLFSSVITLTLYSSVNMGTRTIQKANPTLNLVQQLEKSHSNLICPCERLSINYEYLFELKASYHQICSSEFVSSQWIEDLNNITDYSRIDYPYNDFSVTSSSTFQLISSLCQLSNETVSNALYQFGKNQLISAQLLRNDLFLKQMNSTIDQFQLALPNEFLRLIQLIQNVTNINQFLSGEYVNFRLRYYNDSKSKNIMSYLIIGSLATEGNGRCFCANNFTCRNPSVLYGIGDEENQIVYNLSNFYVGCYPIEALLPSTLECFYDNNPCLDTISYLSNQTTYKNIHRLNSSQSSQYLPNSTVDDLLDQLFLDSWSRTYLYESYFNQCQPSTCSYTINQRRNLLEIITTITGLIGGLSTLFKTLSPYILSIFLYLIHSFKRTNEESVCTNPMRLIKKWGEKIINLNLFEDVDNPSFDEHEIYLERQTTRSYLILLVLIIAILIISTSLVYRSNEEFVNITSLQTFIDFQQLHNSTFVNCPCTNFSTVRSRFLQIEPIFHQICSSDFVLSPWLSLLFNNYRNKSTYPVNTSSFSSTGFTHFQSLSIMCTLAKEAVIDGLNIFLQTSVVSSQMPSISLFNSQMTTSLKDFQSSLSTSFIHNLQIVRSLVQGNGLISVYSTNWNPFLLDIIEDPTVYMKSQFYGECQCALSSSCISNSTDNIPGYVVGCLPIESFLRSTTECLYDQLCVNQISRLINQFIRIPAALNQSNSRFSSKSLFNDLVEEMFIESWSLNISYASFFEECQPMSCSYLLIEKYNILYVLTTLLALYGGITILLKLFLPLLIKQFYQFIHKFKRQIRPLDSH